MTETNSTDLAANGAEKYPETVRVTTGSASSMGDSVVQLDDDDGPAEEAVRAFDSVGEVWQLLTDRRLEVMRSIMTAPPDSISDLAERLDRNYSEIHGDVEVLADHDIVYFDTDGRAKKPVIPYERVRVDIEVVADADTGPAAVS
jgi:predicted transcriptional regulator